MESKLKSYRKLFKVGEPCGELEGEVAVYPNVRVIIQLAQIVLRRSLLAPWLQVAVEFAKSKLRLTIESKRLRSYEHGRENRLVERVEI